MDEGLREAYALAIAVGQMPDFLSEHLGETADLDDICGAPAKSIGRKVPKIGCEA